MKIGIVTINDYINYGNRLQNYALTMLLKNEGLEVVNNIEVYTKEDWVNNTNGVLKKIIKKLIPFILIYKKIDFSQKHIDPIYQERFDNFKEFSERFSETIKAIVVPTHKSAQRYFEKTGIDCFVVGSDQVWNPYYEGKDYQFLTFVPEHMRFSFAASIGSDSIPDIRKEYYKTRLSEMRYLSVREEKAAEIVFNLTGRNADVTLDPTLLLPNDEWDKLVKKPKIFLEEKYICTYFLGEIPGAVKLFAEKKKLKIYQLNSLEDKEFFGFSPEEFLFMIKNAEYILTDSFHAVAFSIKFHKDFYVFRREQLGVNNMFSRIETIIKKMNLENRIQERDGINEDSGVIDWEFIDKILENEREKSINKFLEVMRL